MKAVRVHDHDGEALIVVLGPGMVMRAVCWPEGVRTAIYFAAPHEGAPFVDGYGHRFLGVRETVDELSRALELPTGSTP